MLRPVFELMTPADFDELGPCLGIGPLVLLGFKFTERNLVLCVFSIAVGIWFDDGDE